jgi:hypothetical protein
MSLFFRHLLQRGNQNANRQGLRFRGTVMEELNQLSAVVRAMSKWNVHVSMKKGRPEGVHFL